MSAGAESRLRAAFSARESESVERRNTMAGRGVRVVELVRRSGRRRANVERAKGLNGAEPDASSSKPRDHPGKSVEREADPAVGAVGGTAWLVGACTADAALR